MRESIVNNIVEQIKNLIVYEKMMPGDKLPSERVLSAYLGVSRNSLREALKTVEALGILEIRHGAGIFLRQPNFEAVTLPIMAYSLGDRDILLELVEARKIVDVEIAGLAAQRANESNTATLKEYMDRCRENREKYSEDGASRTEFEALLARVAGNRILISIQEATHALWKSKQKEIGLFVTHPDIQHAEHMMIYKAVLNRDPVAAREAMVYHIEAPLRILDRKK